MKELRVRLLILFSTTGAIVAAGHFDHRAPELYVLTENHLILRPDQVEDQPRTMVATVESDELTPASDDLEPAPIVELAVETLEDPKPAAVVTEADETQLEAKNEEREITYFAPTKLGEKRRVKTYLANADEPSAAPVTALPFTIPAAPGVKPVAAGLPSPGAALNFKPVAAATSRVPASVTTRTVQAAAAGPSRSVVSKARPDDVRACVLELESPNGGEVLSQSVNERVLWKSSGVAGSVRVKLMRGEDDLGLLTLVRDDGSTLVRIPDLVEPGPGYRLRIEAAQDPLCYDDSDAEFSIAP